MLTVSGSDSDKVVKGKWFLTWEGNVSFMEYLKCMN